MNDLYEILDEKEGLAGDRIRIRLTYNGRRLEENKTLDDYNIGDMSTLHFSLRMRAGGDGPGQSVCWLWRSKPGGLVE